MNDSQKYLEEIPLVIRNVIKGMCNEARQILLVYLMKNGPKSFIEISDELSLPKNNIAHHIKTLMKSGLIYNFYTKNEFNNNYSYYELSNLGKYFMVNLISMVEPNKLEKKDYDYLTQKKEEENIQYNVDVDRLDYLIRDNSYAKSTNQLKVLSFILLALKQKSKTFISVNDILRIQDKFAKNSKNFEKVTRSSIYYYILVLSGRNIINSKKSVIPGEGLRKVINLAIDEDLIYEKLSHYTELKPILNYVNEET